MQSTAAVSIVGSSVSLQFFGLTWGTIVQKTSYPRLGLVAHTQFMAEGAMVLLAGITLHQASLIKIGTVQSQILY
jgi:hypothetical protein